MYELTDIMKTIDVYASINISLKHLKLPKNHYKTDLFFGQLKHLKFTFTFLESIKNETPAPHFSIGLFPLFLTFFWKASLSYNDELPYLA